MVQIIFTRKSIKYNLNLTQLKKIITYGERVLIFFSRVRGDFPACNVVGVGVGVFLCKKKCIR